MLTIESLISAGVAPTQARAWLEPLSKACEAFDITTGPRLAGFIAQCHVESAGFTAVEEGLFYRTPERIAQVWPSRFRSALEAGPYARNPQGLANKVYANRNGNGDEASGDGWRYRGRGLIQLTGRENYADAASELGRPYIEQPELVAQPDDAALTAAWYWATRKCNLLADSAQWDAITRAINGNAMMHAAERRAMTDDGLRAFA